MEFDLEALHVCSCFFCGAFYFNFLSTYSTDDLKDGKLVGKDAFGNEYYENKRWYVGRSRWVVYSQKRVFDYDGSQIPPDWHRWMHYTTDVPPTDKPLDHHKWMIKHIENPTGTDDIYVPYSTSRPKILGWKPPKPSQN